MGNLSQADKETFWALAWGCVGESQVQFKRINNLKFFACKDIISLFYMCLRGAFRFLGLWSWFTGLGFLKILFCSFALFQSGNVFFFFFLGLEVLE